MTATKRNPVEPVRRSAWGSRPHYSSSGPLRAGANRGLAGLNPGPLRVFVILGHHVFQALAVVEPQSSCAGRSSSRTVHRPWPPRRSPLPGNGGRCNRTGPTAPAGKRRGSRAPQRPARAAHAQFRRSGTAAATLWACPASGGLRVTSGHIQTTAAPLRGAPALSRRAPARTSRRHRPSNRRGSGSNLWPLTARPGFSDTPRRSSSDRLRHSRHAPAPACPRGSSDMTRFANRTSRP